MSQPTTIERTYAKPLSPEEFGIKLPRSTEIDPNAWSLGIDIQNRILNDRSLMASDFGLEVREWLKLPQGYNHDFPSLGDTLHKLTYAAINGLEMPAIHGSTHDDYFHQVRYKLVVGQLQDYLSPKDEADPYWWQSDSYSVDTKSLDFENLPIEQQRKVFGAIIRRQHDHIAHTFPGCDPEKVLAEMIHSDYVSHATNNLIHAFKDDNPLMQNVLSDIYLLARLEQTGPILPGTNKAGDFSHLSTSEMRGAVDLIDSLKWRLEADRERTASLGGCAVKHQENVLNFQPYLEPKPKLAA